MARKKKNGSQEKTSQSLVLATTILNLIITLLKLVDTILEKLLD